MGYSKWGPEKKRGARRAIGHCQICLITPEELGRPIDDALEMDHDHDGNHNWDIRGILCGSCNGMVGYMQRFKDSKTEAEYRAYYERHARIGGLGWSEWFERTEDYLTDHGWEFLARYRDYIGTKESKEREIEELDQEIYQRLLDLDFLDAEIARRRGEMRPAQAVASVESMKSAQGGEAETDA